MLKCKEAKIEKSMVLKTLFRAPQCSLCLFDEKNGQNEPSLRRPDGNGRKPFGAEKKRGECFSWRGTHHG
jgi:hypothetical protein